MRVRLRATTGKDSKPVVDRSGHGRINGLAVATKGVAKGHGFELDDKSLDLIAAQLSGGRGRWTHGDPCGDSLGQHLGRWENVRRAGDYVVGDFAFSPLASKVQPEGLSVDAPTYLMDMADAEPDAAGVSVVTELGEHEVAKDGRGELLRDASGEPRRFARPLATPRADFVADPAANPDGLLAPTGLSEAASLLDRVAQVHGSRNVRAALLSWLQEPNDQKESGMDIEALKKKHGEELAAKDASIAALTATVSELKAAEDKRQADAIDGYVASLKKDALPNAIEEKKLEQVRVLLKAGHGEAARMLGSALLSAATASAAPGGRVLPLGPEGPGVLGDRAKAETAYAAEQLRALGWTVELSADGSAITKKTPPAAVRAGKA